MTTHRLYCICGTKMEAAANPPEVATALVDWFLGEHTGKPGHGLTDARTALRARQKADRINDRARAILRDAFPPEPAIRREDWAKVERP